MFLSILSNYNLEKEKCKEKSFAFVFKENTCQFVAKHAAEQQLILDEILVRCPTIRLVISGQCLGLDQESEIEEELEMNAKLYY